MSHSDEKVKMSDNGLRIEEKMCYKGTQFFGVSIASWSFISFSGLLIIIMNIIIKPVGKL